MSVYVAREQFIRHQTVKRTQARSEDFHIHVVRALLHTRVFMKFKLSCAVYIHSPLGAMYAYVCIRQSTRGCVIVFVYRYVITMQLFFIKVCFYRTTCCNDSKCYNEQ